MVSTSTEVWTFLEAWSEWAEDKKWYIAASFQHLPHGLNALTLLLYIGMDIEVERGADVGVAEENADGFVVAFALNTTGGEAVPEAVKAHFWETQLVLELVEVCAICARFCWFSRVGENIEVSTDNLFQRAHQRQEVTGHGNLPD